jgi:hypothetical protein
MPLSKDDIRNIKKNNAYNQPTVVGYNRLEGIPRSTDYGRSLRAEVHDALWMLTRQWQMGEFDAEDTGSAIKTRILADHRAMTQFKGNNNMLGPLQSLAIPLEMAIEREKQLTDLTLRIESGKLFKDILVNAWGLKAQLDKIIGAFNPGLIELTSASQEEKLLLQHIKSDPQTFELYQSLKHRVIDGFAAYTAIKNGSFQTWVNTVLNYDLNSEKAMNAAKVFLSVFESKYIKNIPDAWQPEQLEYAFSLLDQSGDTVLEAQEYSNGNLDWYNLDIAKLPSARVKVKKSSFIPVPVTYAGMPKPRWWQMEDGTVNFGSINVSKPDLLTMLSIDFALIYGNDWLIVPYPMEVDTLCEIQGILVTDVFGYHTYIPPVSGTSVSVPDKQKSWEKWSLFRHSMLEKNALSATPKHLFYLVPSLLKTIQQDPLEKVSFMRDEMANLVWAYENIIPLASGKGQKAYEVHLCEKLINDDPPTTPTQDAPMKYILGSDIPFYQIPFMPVAVPGSNPVQMRLQRATMPQKSEVSKPRGIILNENNYIRPNEIVREGIVVTRAWQRVRWINGVTCQWIGRKKSNGKGEGTSGLVFDQVKY